MAEGLYGKAAVVTGSSGIGLGCALRLAELGVRVYLCGNSQEHNTYARQRVAGLSISVEDVDVSENSQVASFASFVSARETDLRLLLNAAAIQPYGTVETTTPEEWDRTLRTNLSSCYLTSHHFYPLLKGRPGASIIHLASVQGHANQRNVLAYATTKGALHALTRAMAVDCAHDGVRVNSISPGSVRTPLLEFAARELTPPGGTMEDTIEEFGKSHPVGRVGTVEEVAELAVYLASDKAGFCTGGDYAIDGGLRAQLGV